MSTEYHHFHIHSQFAQLLGHIRRGQIESLDQLLSSPQLAGQVLHLRDRNGRTALHHAADMPKVTPPPPLPPIGSVRGEQSSSLSSSSRSLLLDIAQRLIRVKPELVEAQDNEGNTPLHLAVINGHLLLTKFLLRHMNEVQINLGDYELHTAIHWATVCGELDCLAAVLDAGGDVATADIYGAHPLHYATQCLTESLNYGYSGGGGGGGVGVGVGGININNTNINGKPIRPQSSSRFYGNTLAVSKYGTRKENGLRVLHHLLAQPAVDVNCVDNEGRTPLIWSASSGNSDALLALVKAGAEISQQDKDGLSALHCASSRGHYKCVEILIMICGADVHQLDSSGCTPLFYATALGHADCVRLLLDSGADFDHQDNKGRTAAHCGASKGQLETLKILHQHGANLWLKNVRGDMPLHEAVKSGRKDLVKWLLEMNPKSINDCNLYGRSALHIAAFNNNLDLVRYLHQQGADINAVMKVRAQYLTPLDAAQQNNASTDVVQYLTNAGAQHITQIDQHLSEYIKNQMPNGGGGGGGMGKTTEIPLQRKARHINPNTGGDTGDGDQYTTNTTKLPNLVNNNNDRQQQPQQQPHSPTLHDRTALSTASSSVFDVYDRDCINGHGSSSNKLHNVREFETDLTTVDRQHQRHNHNHQPTTHLKQAIITNVYLTTPANALVTASGGQLQPVYIMKRVPPLGKRSNGVSGGGGGGGSKRKTGQTHRSRSRSDKQNGRFRDSGTRSKTPSSVGVGTEEEEEEDEQEQGEGIYDGDGDNEPVTGDIGTGQRASVVLKTHDTYKSAYETGDDKIVIEQELINTNTTTKPYSTKKTKTKTTTGSDDDDEEEEEEEEKAKHSDRKRSLVKSESKTKIEQEKSSRKGSQVDSKIGDIGGTKEEQKEAGGGDGDDDEHKTMIDHQSIDQQVVMNNEEERIDSRRDSGFETEQINKKIVTTVPFEDEKVVKIDDHHSKVDDDDKKEDDGGDGGNDDDELNSRVRRSVMATDEVIAEEDEDEENVEKEDKDGGDDEEKRSQKKKDKIDDDDNEDDESVITKDQTQKSETATITDDIVVVVDESDSRKDSIDIGSITTTTTTSETQVAQRDFVQNVDDNESMIGDDGGGGGGDEKESIQRTRRSIAEEDDKEKKEDVRTIKDDEEEDAVLVPKDGADDDDDNNEKNKLHKKSSLSKSSSISSDASSSSSSSSKASSAKLRTSVQENLTRKKSNEEENIKEEEDEDKDKKQEEEEEDLPTYGRSTLSNMIEESVESGARFTKNLFGKGDDDKKDGKDGDGKNDGDDDQIEKKIRKRSIEDNESIGAMKSKDNDNDETVLGEKDGSDDDGGKTFFLRQDSLTLAEHQEQQQQQHIESPLSPSKKVEDYLDQMVSSTKKDVIAQLSNATTTTPLSSHKASLDDDDGDGSDGGKDKPKEDKTEDNNATVVDGDDDDKIVKTKTVTHNGDENDENIDDDTSLQPQPAAGGLYPIRKRSVSYNAIQEMIEEGAELINDDVKDTRQEEKKNIDDDGNVKKMTDHQSDGAGGGGGGHQLQVTPQHKQRSGAGAGVGGAGSSGSGVEDFDDNASSVTFVQDKGSGGGGGGGDGDGSKMFDSSFPPLKPFQHHKRNSHKYDYVQPKVDSFWNSPQHHSGQQQHQVQHYSKQRGGGGGGTKQYNGGHGRFHGGELVTSSSGDGGGVSGGGGDYESDHYAKISPRILNQTVEKYLRKYYLERKLFEELYDLKRYQIRTGKSNEPQAVKRLVEKFRRDVRAPGMADFKGPYSYRAYEMYLYDLLRKLSRSNEKKIAFMDKSISYEDLHNSFEGAEGGGGNDNDAAAFESEFESSGDDYNRWRHSEEASHHHRSHHHHRHHYPRYKSGQGTSGGGGVGIDYDHHPLGPTIDYRYEYHKSQHFAKVPFSGTDGGDSGGAGGKSKNDGTKTTHQVVDVICENLYKRTGGLGGAKVDEVAIHRKEVVFAGAANATAAAAKQETKKDDGGDEGVGQTKQQQQDQVCRTQKLMTKSSKRHHRSMSTNADLIISCPPMKQHHCHHLRCIDPDGDSGLDSDHHHHHHRCCCGGSKNAKQQQQPLQSVIRYASRPPLKRPRMYLRRSSSTNRIKKPSPPVEVIKARWAPYKRGGGGDYDNDRSMFITPTTTTTSPHSISVWYELNKQPWQEYYANSMNHYDDRLSSSSSKMKKHQFKSPVPLT